jgi:hypothetical protein
MTARVIVLSDRISPNGHCRVERDDAQASEQEWLRDWDADIVATLSIEYGGAPARTSVRWWSMLTGFGGAMPCRFIARAGSTP